MNTKEPMLHYEMFVMYRRCLWTVLLTTGFIIKHSYTCTQMPRICTWNINLYISNGSHFSFFPLPIYLFCRSMTIFVLYSGSLQCSILLHIKIYLYMRKIGFVCDVIFFARTLWMKWSNMDDMSTYYFSVAECVTAQCVTKITTSARLHKSNEIIQRERI